MSTTHIILILVGIALAFMGVLAVLINRSADPYREQQEDYDKRIND